MFHEVVQVVVVDWLVDCDVVQVVVHDVVQVVVQAVVVDCVVDCEVVQVVVVDCDVL